MKRKVIKLAQNTLVVSLPSEWAKKFGVCKGDELEVLEDADALVLRCGKPVSVARDLVLDISSSSAEYVKSLVSVVHKLGFDRVEFVSREPVLLDVVGARVDECIGFEVVERTDSRSVVRSVAGDAEQSLESMVRRAFFVTLQMASLFSKGVRDGSDVRKEMLALERTNNRLSNYCHRLLNRQSKGAHTSLWYLLVWLLESIGDDYRDLAVEVQAGGSASTDAQALVGEVERHLRALHEFVFTGRLQSMDGLREQNARLRARLSAMVQDGSGQRRLSSGLRSIVQRAYDCFGSATGIQFLRDAQGP